jgi:hypothetical protein
MLFCAIGVAFLVAMVVVCFSCDIVEQNKTFYDSLTPQQQQIYQTIKKERLRIFLQASIAGLIIGLAVLYVMSVNNIEKVNKIGAGCILLATAFATQYFWYMIAPKSDWMVLHLTQSQIPTWQQLYTSYQRRYHVALVIGLVGYFLLGYGMCPYMSQK